MISSLLSFIAILGKRQASKSLNAKDLHCDGILGKDIRLSL